MATENQTNAKLCIYCKELHSIEDYEKIAEESFGTNRYWDKNTQIGKEYVYTITTVDEAGNESEKGFMTMVKRELIEE